MDLLPDQEQTEIVNSSRAFLAAECPLERVRELAQAPSVVDAGLWKQMAALGWFALALPESDGGVGYGLPEQALVCREIGRALVPGPLIPTIVAAGLAAASGESALTSSILSGEAVVGLAEPMGAVDIGTVTHGVFRTFDAADAALLLAVDEHGAALLPAGAVTEPAARRGIDAATRVADAHVAQVRAEVWAPAARFPARLWAWVLTAAELVGMAEASRDMSAEHARTREQFGRPIGTFQAVKFRCADTAMRAEAALQITSYASLAVDRGLASAAFHAPSARVVAADAAVRNAEDNIQNHGGMGFTDQLDAHLYLKRAVVRSKVFGTTRADLAALLREPAALRAG